MHYVPESAREFLQAPPADRLSAAERGFHYRSAPVYLLTACVAALLAADFLLDVAAPPEWQAYRTLFGFRLALLAAVLGGARILYRTLESLFEGRIGADLALTVACLAAILLGEHATAALVVFVALCGESIEGFTVDRAQRAIRGAFDLTPAVAHVERGERVEDVPVTDLVAGDRIVVKPGERIPVDGAVVAGESAVDQSALTGESLPIDKRPGDAVFAGTLNQFGSVTVAAERVGDDTALARVIQLVAEAAARKSPLERTADRLARLFLPVVLFAAAATLVGWWFATGEWRPGFRPALGVLIVACPCPLVLATPTAVMAAMAWLARTGVVVKGSIALERLATVDVFAFDKTGTLTRGELALGSIRPLADLPEDELLRVAAIAERRSEHPIARLVVRTAEGRNQVIPAAAEFVAFPGGGVTATVRATQLGPWAQRVDEEAPHERMVRLVVGNPRLFEREGIAIPAAVSATLDDLDAAGQTVLLVAADGVVLGALGVRDAVRAESRDVLAALRHEGIGELALLSGDRPRAAEDVARALGPFDFVAGGLFPEDKARWVADRLRSGRRVAMVGDGVNDAPALAAATVGLALGGVGSDLAAEAGDVVLLGDPLRPLPGLLRLSRELVRNIRQSIFLFAFGMNAVGMLLCGVGLLSPVAGAVFHECSSLAVMFNAMRLLWFERRREADAATATGRLGAFVDRLAAACSPAQLVYRLVDRRAFVAKLAAATAAIVWLTSNVVLIRDDEQALVTRFGRLEAELRPGWHWRWPGPFERIVRERVDLVRSVEIGFRRRPRHAETADVRTRTIEWTSEHSELTDEPVLDEALVLTGDEVPVELTAEVQYRIADLARFAFAASEPERTLHAAAETAIRERAARTSLDGVLTDSRRRLETDCLDQLRRRIAPYGLGIEVVDFALLDVHPPRAVVPAYRDVADALEEQQQRINEAEAYYASQVLAAGGERAIRLLSATAPADGPGVDADRRGPTTGFVSDWSLTDESWRRVAAETPDGELLLSGQAAGTLHAAKREAFARTQAAAGSAARFGSLLEAYRAERDLTRERLYWKTIGDALSSRPLTILDPAVAGRRHLLFLDPQNPAAAPQFAPPPTPAAEPQEPAEPPAKSDP